MFGCDVTIIDFTLPLRADECRIDKCYRVDGRPEPAGDDRSGQAPIE